MGEKKNYRVSAMEAVIKAKCPRCRKGNLFPVFIMSYRRLSDINQVCPKCKETLVPEPDFYYGAMYISYAFSVALVVTVMVALNVLFERPALSTYLVSVVVANLLLLPLMLRYSKVLYLYAMGRISYDESISDR
ncbi:DUF983 domain-containing protein [Lunatibacter salilacus]|uniref:DUF983 domain-containing protein n=1 Tax=Lunatibacter salilacus TaxID=2483804 RepID=UPI001F33DE88|nr:DUF983 domain-containing protein [Lunatibacter salilacus]